jgi:Flp pilus assembly protein TadG
MRYASQSIPSQQGSTIVEFSLGIIMIFTLMFGIIDFSRALYAYHWVSSSAHLATRWASVRGKPCKPTGAACPATATDVTNYVKSIVSPGIYVNAAATAGNPGYLAITTNWPSAGTTDPNGCSTPPTNNPGCWVKVQVQYTFGFSLPYLPSSTRINMSSTSQFIISH